MLRVLISCFMLVSLCVVIHTFGLVMLAEWTVRRNLNVESTFSIRRYTGLLVTVFAFLTILHLVETLVWAAFYAWWGLFSDFETSWYFSVGSYTTIGYGDVVLPTRWRMLGGVEGISGVLLCGLSASFLFVVVNHMFADHIRQRARSASDITIDSR